VLPKEFAKMMNGYFMEGLTRKRSFRDDTLIVAVIDDLPAFGVVVPLANRLAQHGSQSSPAPNVAAEERLKAKWIQHLPEPRTPNPEP
jgi:hypothetical protein